MARQTQSRPSLQDVLLQSMTNTSAGIRCCAPGQIVALRSGDLVDVRLSVREQDSGGNLEQMPTLRKVPLLNVGNARIYTRYPALLGDPVLCLFGDADLDSWKGTLGLKAVDAGTDRRHDLSDCVALPIGWAQTSPGLEMLGFESTVLTNINAAMTSAAALDPVIAAIVAAIIAACDAELGISPPGPPGPSAAFAQLIKTALLPLVVTPDSSAVALVAVLTPLIARLAATGVTPA